MTLDKYMLFVYIINSSIIRTYEFDYDLLNPSLPKPFGTHTFYQGGGGGGGVDLPQLSQKLLLS